MPHWEFQPIALQLGNYSVFGLANDEDIAEASQLLDQLDPTVDEDTIESEHNRIREIHPGCGTREMGNLFALLDQIIHLSKTTGKSPNLTQVQDKLIAILRKFLDSQFDKVKKQIMLDLTKQFDDDELKIVVGETGNEYIFYEFKEVEELKSLLHLDVE